MVFFTCNACGESVKKANVEKHYLTKCRACEILSCIDCGKDFHGDSYKDHTTCITEDQKYGGKNFKATPFKGAVKQNSWIEIVREASMNPSLDPKVRSTLKSIMNCGQDNIPRKKAKFMNFVKNSMHVRETWLVEKVWDTIEKHVSAQSQITKSEESCDDAKAASKNLTDDEELKTIEREDGETKVAGDADKTGKRSKGRGKKKRQGDPLDGADGDGEEDVHEGLSKKKKKKKQKREDGNNGVDVGNGDEDDDVIKVSNLIQDVDPSEQSRQNGISEESEGKGKRKKKRRRQREVDDEPLKTLEHNQSKSDRKSRKRKNETADSRREADKPDQSIKDKKSKKRKREEKENGFGEAIEEDQGAGDLADDDVTEQSRIAGAKFKWEAVIIKVLQSAGGEIRLNKLKKKVLSEYFAQGGDASITSEEKLFIKFNKKVMKNPKLKVYKETVQLKH